MLKKIGKRIEEEGLDRGNIEEDQVDLGVGSVEGEVDQDLGELTFDRKNGG